MSAVFLKIVNMSITASWLILAAIVLRFVLKKAPKWITCLLWAIVAVRLVCPFTFESVLSLVPGKEPIPVNIVMSQRPTVEVGISAIDTPVNTVIADSFTPTPSDSVNPLQIVVPALAIVWIAGIVLLLAYALISYIRLRKTAAASFEISKGVRACDDVKAPFILGIFRPVIYVPSIMEGETLDYVLKHEKAHLSRHDHWWKPLGFLLLAVYWFNPLSWVAYILLCRDIESACDEKVICDMDQPSMAAYSQALLDCSFSRRAIAACPLAFGEVGVKERIKGVLNYKKPAFWVIIIALLACVVVSVCFLTSPKDDEPDLSMLNYKNAISTIMDSEGVFAVHHGSTYTDLLAPDEVVSSESLAVYLDKATWKKRSTPSDKPGSPNSVEFHINNDYIITVYEKPKMAKVLYNGEERYYRTGANDYSLALELFNNATPIVVTFTATVTEVLDMNILVTPSEDSDEFRSADSFSLSLSSLEGDYYEPQVGDVIEVDYNGYILASYPATVGNLYAIRLVSRRTEPLSIITNVTYVGWSDDLIVWDDALNKDTVISSTAFHLPVYKLESVKDLETFEKKFENIMALGNWYDNDIEPFDVSALDYTEEFFDDTAIIVTYLSAGSGSFRYDVKDVTFFDNTLCVNVIQTYTPDVYTDDMGGWLLITQVPKATLADIKSYDAVFEGEAVKEEKPVSNVPKYELQDFETETIISTFSNYDLTHDGIKDTVQVSFITTDEFDGVIGDTMFKYGLMGFVKVFDGSKGVASDSSIIWYHDYGLTHAGNYQFFITQKEGKDYLVQTSLISGQGSNSYEYSVLTFDNANQASVDEQLLTFNDGEKADKAGFFDSLYEWINDDSVLLMAADLEIDRYIYSTNDNIVNPDEYYHRRNSKY